MSAGSLSQTPGADALERPKQSKGDRTVLGGSLPVGEESQLPRVAALGARRPVAPEKCPGAGC